MTELKGHHVLLIFIGFFVSIAAVNAVMIYAAIATFGGVDKQNAYKVGLVFGRELAEAGEQDARAWQVAGHIHARTNEMRIVVTVKDSSGRPLPGLELDARLGHPVNARLDRSVSFIETGVGTYQAITTPVHGTWDIDLQIRDQSRRMFRSVNRSTFSGSSS